MTRYRTFLLAIVTAAAIACSSDSSPTGPDGDGTGPIHGKINNVTFSSLAGVTATYLAASHTYTVSAGEATGGARAVVWSLGDINAAGTYTLGTSLPFRYANVGVGGVVYETSITPGAASHGTLVVEIATASRFKGTITYTGIPSSGYPNATGTATANLSFDLSITGASQ